MPGPRVLSSLLWVGAAGCSGGAGSAEPAAPVAKEAEQVPVAGSLTATAVSLWYGKPPLKQHGFDVTIKNPAGEPRWLVLPDTFPYAGREDPAPGGELSELQVYELSERPMAFIIKGVGANLWAVKLPGGGTMTLRNLKISSWWDEVPATTTLRMIVARELRLGERPLDEVVGQFLLSSSGFVGEAPESAADPRADKFWHMPDNSAVALTIDEESRVEVVVALDVPAK
jgi:hypothetical protein